MRNLLQRHSKLCPGWRIQRHALTSSFSNAGFSYPAPRALNEIVKIDLLANENADKIAHIWTEYHREKIDSVAKVMSDKEMQLITDRASSARLSVIPVYREKGFFNMLCQFQDTCFLVTSLEAYQKAPANASPCVTFSMYNDLASEKSITLIRGDIVSTVNKKESKSLLSSILHIYSAPELYERIVQLNQASVEFDFEAYREALDRKLCEHNEKDTRHLSV